MVVHNSRDREDFICSFVVVEQARKEKDGCRLKGVLAHGGSQQTKPIQKKRKK